MDNLLLITLLAIFLTALAGAYLKRRRRDRALREFDGYHCRLLLCDGASAWGRLRVYPNGLELVYPRAHRDAAGRPRTSFVLFREQYSQVQGIYRYRGELTPENQRRRARDVERSFHPGPWRRFKRGLRNFFDTFRDAINESFGLWLSRLRAGRRGRLLQGQDQRIQSLSEQVVGEVGTAYDPILERYVGHCAILSHELEEQPTVYHLGVLKEYSPDWLSLLDCRERGELRIPLAEPERLRLQRGLDFFLQGSPGALELRVENRGEQALRLLSLHGEGYRRGIDRSLGPGQAQRLRLDDLPEPLSAALPARLDCALVAPERGGQPPPADLVLPALELLVEAERVYDLCLPRAATRLSHGAEFLK